MPKLATHALAVGIAPNQRIYYFAGVAGAYTGLKDELGIDETLTDADKGQPLTAVKELLNAGVAIRIAVRYTDGTKKRTAKILCARSKLDTALGALAPPAMFMGKPIKSAGVPRRMTFY